MDLLIAGLKFCLTVSKLALVSLTEPVLELFDQLLDIFKTSRDWLLMSLYVIMKRLRGNTTKI